MAHTDVISLVNLLSNSQADQTAINGFYREIVQNWGDAEDYLTNATLASITATSEITVPTTIIALLAVVWDERELGRLRLREVEFLDPIWRQRNGTPNSYVTEAESVKTFALYPTPTLKTNTPVAGPEPLGAQYPTYSMTYFHTEERTDVPSYLELALALLILEREYVRESDHQDFKFAQGAGDFGRYLLELIV